MRFPKILFFYYLLLSVVFFGGRMYIMEANHMKQGPVAIEAFHTLFQWVRMFSYFYIVPLLIAGLIGLIRFAKNRKLPLFLRLLMSVLYISLAAGAGAVFIFIFVLLFYGFAP
ncbi:hypothetical protein [Brevibacillus borstelensis]|uniref:hypothetical protein n=1 Tax=Brevibacillus borstelensis TaxID=45462 RepID=UPI0030C53BA0